MDQFQFQYDKEESFESNFNKWRTLNSEERSAYQEPQLSEDEAQILFNKLFGQYKVQGVK